VFTDLAVWMAAFGVSIGLLFPAFCLALGLPAPAVISLPFFAATTSAGIVVAIVNFALARLVVGRRLRRLAEAMTSVEAALAEAVHEPEWAGCDPATCFIPEDSADEAGVSAAAFNRLVRTLARSHAVESARRDFSEILTRETDPDQLAGSALEAMIRLTASDAGAVLVARDDGLATLASHGIVDPGSLAGTEQVRRAMAGSAIVRLRLPAPHLVVDSLLITARATEVLIAPIAFKARPAGAVVLASHARYSTDAVELLDGFRADLGLAVTNTLAHERLERLAAIDPLTDALNRGFGLRRLHEEYSRAARSESPLSLLMLDLDRFKAINDTYGHLTGDRVLHGVAAAMRAAIREGDVLIRYGGEEFLVLLPGACIDDLVVVGERVRAAVARVSIEVDGVPIRVTASVGASAFCDIEESETGLLERTDRALYEAKRAGRDRMVLA
jgi:diguanylate cyclase (GGDEF)-like protein